MELFLISMVVATIAIVFIFVTRHTRKAEKTYMTLERSRKTIGAVFLILLVWTFLLSGNPVLMLVALLGVAVAALYVFVEKPHKQVI